MAEILYHFTALVPPSQLELTATDWKIVSVTEHVSLWATISRAVNFLGRYTCASCCLLLISIASLQEFCSEVGRNSRGMLTIEIDIIIPVTFVESPVTFVESRSIYI